MTIRTGKSGAYSYYACARKVNAGASSCTTRHIRQEKLDALVLDALDRQLLESSRLRRQLSHTLDQSDAAAAQRRQNLALLRAAHADTQNAIRRLVELVEKGMMAPKDPVIAERMGHNRARLETLAGRIAMLERQIGTVSDRITPAVIERLREPPRAIPTALQDTPPH